MESMMEKLCGTRTEENLRTAFAGESQARNKYTYYAKKAGRGHRRPAYSGGGGH